MVLRKWESRSPPPSEALTQMSRGFFCCESLDAHEEFVIESNCVELCVALVYKTTKWLHNRKPHNGALAQLWGKYSTTVPYIEDVT